MGDETKKILVVDDDLRLRSLLERYFKEQGYIVKAAADSEQMDRFLERENYHLMILDLMLPGEDGLSICRRLRGNDNNIPIIMLTAKGDDVDRIIGLELGADDYLAKPFNPRELLARVKAILKRNQARTGKKEEDVKEFDLGIFHFNFPLRILTNHRAKTDEKLSPKEAQLLKMFCEYKNEVLPRSTALEKIWGKDDYFTARSMDVFIAKLRKYLSSDEKLEIDNIHGDGFRLVVTE